MTRLLAAVLVLFVTSAALAQPGLRGSLTDDLRWQMAGDAARARDFSRARSLLESLKNRFPGDPRLHFQLGMVLLALGQPGKAELEARAILSHEPASALGRRLQELARGGHPASPGAAGPSPSPVASRSQQGELWDWGDDVHIVVTVRARSDRTAHDLMLAEGPAPRGQDPRPGTEWLSLAGSRADLAIASLEPWEETYGIHETMAPDGRLAGQWIRPPAGAPLLQTVRLPFHVLAERIELVDAAGHRLRLADLGPGELAGLIVALAHPSGKKPGPALGLSPAQDKLLEMTRLVCRIPPEYTADGAPAGTFRRARILAERALCPSIRGLPDDRLGAACPHLAMPFACPSTLAAPVAALRLALAAHLDRPGPRTARALAEARRALDGRLCVRLVDDIRALRAARPGAGPLVRGDLNLARVVRRLADAEEIWDSAQGGLANVAEAALLLGRHR